MKHILFYLSATLYLFLSAQAMEEEEDTQGAKKLNSIQLIIVNTHYTKKTQLTSAVTYEDKTTEQYTVTLSEKSVEPRTHYNIFYSRPIINISFILQNHDPKFADGADPDGTALAIRNFEFSHSEVQKIVIDIFKEDITIDPKKIEYAKPSKFTVYRAG